MAGRHPFDVIKEIGAGLDFGSLGRGAGQELSNRLNQAGYHHEFDGLDRFKFDGSGGIDTHYGTIDAIRNKGFVQGRRGPEEQALVFQPWHDRSERRALGLPVGDEQNPAITARLRALAAPDMPAPGHAQPQGPVAPQFPVDDLSGTPYIPEMVDPAQQQEPWWTAILRRRQ